MLKKTKGGFDAVKHPTLAGLLASGAVSVACVRGVHCGEYIGTAADGVVVNVGMVGYEDQTEAYLSAHPTPDTW